LISFENLTPEERTKAKNKEASMVTIAKIENRRNIEIAKKMILAGSNNDFIVQMTDLTVEQIEELRHEKEQNCTLLGSSDYFLGKCQK